MHSIGRAMSDDDNLTSTDPGLSKFVDHLRVVHFTIMATCVITIVALSSEAPSTAGRAYDQTNLLLRVKDRWQNGEWLRTVVAQRRDVTNRTNALPFKAILKRELSPEIDNTTHEDPYFFFDLTKSWNLANAPMEEKAAGFRPLYPQGVIARASMDSELRTINDRYDERGLRGATFESLDDAYRIWNHLDQYRNLTTIREVHDGWLVRRPGLEVTKLRPHEGPVVESERGAVCISCDPERPRLLLREDLLQLLSRGPYQYGERRQDTRWFPDIRETAFKTAGKIISEDKDTQCFLFDHDFERTVVISVECVSERLSLQSSLVDGILAKENSLGDFSRSFPDIDDLAKNLKALSLEELQTFFHAEKNRSGEKIELPGVKLPGEAVTSWGTVILVALAAYFFVVFGDFCRRVTPEDKAWNVPWIGTSPDTASRIAFVLSLCITPSTVAYLAWRGVHISSSAAVELMYLFALVMLIALVAAILSYWRAAISNRMARSGATAMPQS
jgi:hypothetical protein